MNPIFTSIGDQELRITIDAESDWYNELINIGKANGSFTLEYDGQKVFGCKVDTVTISASGSGGTVADIVVKLPAAAPFLRTAITNTKYKLLTAEHREELQNRLFELGAKWKTKGDLATTPRNIKGRFLFVSNLGTLTHSASDARFDNSTATELNYCDLLDIQRGHGAASDPKEILRIEKQRRIAKMYGMSDERLRGINGQRHGTVTGRWSGKEPNPCGDPCDMNARSYFVAKGRRIGKTGQSWAELEQRIAAFYSAPSGASHFRDMYEQAITAPLTGDELRGKSMSTNWKFDSVHPKDIDFDEITGAVTRHFPIAIVRGAYTTKETRERDQRTVNGHIKYEDGTVRKADGSLLITESLAASHGALLIEDASPLREDYTVTVKHDENYLVVHKTLIDKALVINKQLPDNATPWRANGNGSRVFRGITTKQLSAWINWAKDVKAARWHDEDRRKVTFEVNLVSV
jgi:hypothetical protein